jgi:Ala-tRNA(Pro) deacylase
MRRDGTGEARHLCRPAAADRNNTEPGSPGDANEFFYPRLGKCGWCRSASPAFSRIDARGAWMTADWWDRRPAGKGEAMIAISVSEFLRSRGVPFSVVSHRTAFTAQEEAAVAHVPGRMWAKTVVCVADGAPVLAVLPAHYSIEIEPLRQLIGATAVRLANEVELGPMYPGCELGAMPPLGPLYNQRVYMDESLSNDQEVVFNAGTHTDAVRMKLEDFVQLVQPVVGAFGRKPGPRLH